MTDTTEPWSIVVRPHELWDWMAEINHPSLTRTEYEFASSRRGVIRKAKRLINTLLRYRGVETETILYTPKGQ